MTKKQTTPVDPELKRQLASVTKDQSIEAVFTLRAPAGDGLVESDQVRQTVDRIVKSAQSASGQEVRDLHVLPMAQSFALAAPAGVVQAILESTEIASAMANVQQEELAIKPVTRSPRKPAPRPRGKPPKGSR
jgi:hypothetical protein